MKERDIEKILVDEVRKIGGRAYKWVSPGNDGVPDRIIIFPQKAPVFVELKTDTGRLTQLQKLQIKRLTEFGQDVRVIYGIRGVCQMLRDLGYKTASSDMSRKYGL